MCANKLPIRQAFKSYHITDREMYITEIRKPRCFVDGQLNNAVVYSRGSSDTVSVFFSET